MTKFVPYNRATSRLSFILRRILLLTLTPGTSRVGNYAMQWWKIEKFFKWLLLLLLWILQKLQIEEWWHTFFITLTEKKGNNGCNWGKLIKICKKCISLWNIKEFFKWETIQVKKICYVIDLQKPIKAHSCVMISCCTKWEKFFVIQINWFYVLL